MFTFCTYCILRCIVCAVVSCLVCIVVVVLCVLLSSYVYLSYYVCIVVFTLNAGLLARSQYSEGSATGHLGTGFSWFPCVYKQMLRWFPRFRVATTCFSCRLQFICNQFHILYTCKITTQLQLINIIIIIIIIIIIKGTDSCKRNAYKPNVDYPHNC